MQYPTCTHGILKLACQVCNPSQAGDEVLCGDAEQGDRLVRCQDCGKLRSCFRAHGYSRPSHTHYGFG